MFDLLQSILDILLMKLIICMAYFFFLGFSSYFSICRFKNTSRLLNHLFLSLTIKIPFLPDPSFHFFLTSHLVSSIIFTFPSRKYYPNIHNTSVSVKLLLYQDLMTTTMPKTDYRCLLCARKIYKKNNRELLMAYYLVPKLPTSDIIMVWLIIIQNSW